MSEPLPDPPPIHPPPTSWRVCALCGAIIGAPEVHREWHQRVVNRARAAEDVLAAARSRLSAIESRLTALEQGSTP